MITMTVDPAEIEKWIADLEIEIIPYKNALKNEADFLNRNNYEIIIREKQDHINHLKTIIGQTTNN